MPYDNRNTATSNVNATSRQQGTPLAFSDELSETPPESSPPLSTVSSATSDSPPALKEYDSSLEYTTTRNEIEDILGRLSRLAASIRRLGGHFRDAKAANFVDKDEEGVNLTSEFAEIVTLYVDHKFPKATEALRHRVVESVARRRNRLAYRRRHQQKLASTAGNSIMEQSREQRKEGPILETSHDKPEKPVKRLLSATSATVLRKQDVSVIKTPVPSNYSQSIARFSARSTELRYPRAPKLGKQDVFECPFCLVLCPVREAHGKHWK